MKSVSVRDLVILIRRTDKTISFRLINRLHGVSVCFLTPNFQIIQLCCFFLKNFEPKFSTLYKFPHLFISTGLEKVSCVTAKSRIFLGRIKDSDCDSMIKENCRALRIQLQCEPSLRPLTLRPSV